jgi:hypothetical protein
MSYQLTHLNENTQELSTLTHDIVSQKQSIFKVKNVNERSCQPLSIRVAFVLIDDRDMKISVLKIADFSDFRFYTLFRRRLLFVFLD